MIEAMCWKCGKAIAFDPPIGRSLLCPSCGADVRVCRNCRFWSPGSWHDCAERTEELVRDKERANFCDHFQLNPAFRKDHPGAEAGKRAAGDPGSGPRSAFDNLFK